MEAMLSHMPFDVVLILLPLAAGMLCFLWPAIARLLGVVSTAAGLVSVLGLGWQIQQNGPHHHVIGGWNAPLGIELFADGLSLLMLAATATVGFAVSIYSTGYFTTRHDEIRFWPIWLLLLGALNALFLSADIFNLYVTLELMGLASVALAALTGDKNALAGATRYLLATLLGSMCYLFGVALLYHGFGTVDIATLATRIDSSPPVWAALGLITVGLALKTALFPLHFWLPPAHASAPAPVSALLSALVVKASFYILLRLWLSVFGSIGDGVDTLLGLLGATAVLWGSLQALRQPRLKLLIACSTVAHIGYLFLAFPLTAARGGLAWNAVAYLALSHALAKAAMFLSAGNLLRFGGHDQIADLDRVVQRLPLTAGAFALAGVSIMGLPPSGGFVGKWLLLQAALDQGHWGIPVVLILGGLLAAAYIFKVLGHAFTQAPRPHEAGAVPARMEWSAFLLALAAIVLGFIATPVMVLINIGDAFVTPEIRS